MEIRETVQKVEEKKSERGAGMVEYAILAGIIIGVALLAKNAMSTAVSTSFSAVTSSTIANMSGQN